MKNIYGLNMLKNICHLRGKVMEKAGKDLHHLSGAFRKNGGTPSHHPNFH